jgi:two-component system sensor histidine kinase UhpB
MSLRVRIILTIGAMLSISLAFGAGLSWLHAVRSVRTEMEAALNVGAHVIESAVRDNRDSGKLAQAIASFDGDRHLRAMLVDANGRILAQSTLLTPTDPAPDWFAALIGRDQPALTIALPAISADVILRTDPRNELTEVWTDIGDALAITAIFCGLTFPIIHWLLGRALAPLNALSRAFLAIGSDEPHASVKEEGPPELVHLARGFNAMVARLALFENRNARLREQLSTIQEEERVQLARDLHDDIGPYLFAIRVDAAAIRRSLDAAGQTAFNTQIEAIESAVGHVQQQVRSILIRLRSGGLPEFGLHQAITNLAAFWHSRHPGIEIDVDSLACGDGFGPTLDGAIYRIVQESLHNAIRHGSPNAVSVRIDAPSGAEVVIEVEDDGAGLAPAGRADGLGLRGMAERAASLGGALSIRDRIDRRGVTVTARLPLETMLKAVEA